MNAPDDETVGDLIRRREGDGNTAVLFEVRAMTADDFTSLRKAFEAAGRTRELQ
jgi:hypothetical protein